MRKSALPAKPTKEGMEITPERALWIKQALIRQYEDQYGVIVTEWEEIEKQPEEPV